MHVGYNLNLHKWTTPGLLQMEEDARLEAGSESDNSGMDSDDPLTTDTKYGKSFRYVIDYTRLLDYNIIYEYIILYNVLIVNMLIV